MSARASSATRRRIGCALLGVALAALAMPFGACAAIDLVAGEVDVPRGALADELSPDARALLDRAFEGLDPARVLDHHVHVAGTGRDGSGCTIDPRRFSWLHPWKRVQTLVFLRAAGVEDLERADAAYLERLDSLARSEPRIGRMLLYAFDRRWEPDGTCDESRTDIHVPNDFVLELAARDPSRRLAAVSIHPYRPDAVAELERCAARGARCVKWLPNAMGIDPADARCDPFYAALARLDATLLVHTGAELAVGHEGDDDLGNPLRLRRALERGVRVVALHCGSLGESEDLDDPARTRRPNFELFLRLADEPRWRERLYGEISSLTFANRDPAMLATLIDREDLHARLVNGSDHPLPAIRVLTPLSRFVRAGMLDEREAELLEEVRARNPLAFDLALKRTLRHPRSGARLPAAVFEARRWAE